MPIFILSRLLCIVQADNEPSDGSFPIPIRVGSMIPPGSSSGMINLPKSPAISPTIIQEMRPILRPFFRIADLNIFLRLNPGETLAANKCRVRILQARPLRVQL